MKISNWGDGDGLKVEGLWVTLGEYEHVTVELPGGHRIDVYANEVRVAEPGTARTRDGKRIWPARRLRRTT